MRIKRLVGDLGRAAILCLLTSGVTPAQAQTPSAQYSLSVETCAGSYVTSDGVEHFLAEHKFPMRSASSLARVAVLGHIAAAGDAPPSYSKRLVQDGVYIRDGSVAVACGTSATGKLFDRVEFIMPRSYVIDLDSRDPWE